MDKDRIKEIVKGEYRQAALQVRSGGRSCCGTTLQGNKLDAITHHLYSDQEIRDLPPEAVMASFGCGNPTALVDLRPGETVLDLGSGGGIDVLLSAKRVGPRGKAYGLDMTDEMVDLARENQIKAGLSNVEFLKGEIEQIPLPDASVDVIISNCVVNLSGEKERVLAEAFRVLRPGGRLAISDIVIRGSMPVEIKFSIELWAGCVAGALDEQQYVTLLSHAGFLNISIQPVRVYRAEFAREFLSGAGLDVERLASHADGKFMSAFICAAKPAYL
jgi:arsenite methyltransferase